MMKLLLVEDQERYREAARSYFSERLEIKVDYASDYQEFRQLFFHNNFDGALIDCFFPDNKGTSYNLFGRLVVEEMARDDPAEREARDLLARVKDYIDVTDRTIRRYVKVMARWIPNNEEFIDPSTGKELDPFVYLCREFRKVFTKEQLTDYFKEGLRTIFEEKDRHYGAWGDDLYQVLLDEMERSEDCQPLGIAVAQQMSDTGVPFVLVTSTYHHDKITQPIQDYASRKGWKLIDCERDRSDDKATVGFWDRAFKSLEHRI